MNVYVSLTMKSITNILVIGHRKVQILSVQFIVNDILKSGTYNLIRAALFTHTCF